MISPLMLLTEVEKRMGLTAECAEAAKGQMCVFIQNAFDRWNNMQQQEELLWQEAQPIILLVVEETTRANPQAESHDVRLLLTEVAKRMKFTREQAEVVVDRYLKQLRHVQEWMKVDAQDKAAAAPKRKRRKTNKPRKQASAGATNEAASVAPTAAAGEASNEQTDTPAAAAPLKRTLM